MKNVVPFARSTGYLMRHARSNAQKKRYLDALELYRRAAEQNPQSSEALMGMAHMYTQMGLSEMSDRLLRRIATAGGGRDLCCFGMAQNACARGDYLSAYGYLVRYLAADQSRASENGIRELLPELVVRISPGTPRDEVRAARLLSVAVACGESGEWERAGRLAERALLRGDGQAHLHAFYALALTHLGKKAAAAEEMRAAWKTGKEDVRTLLTLSRALHAAGKNRAAGRLLDRAAKMHLSDDEYLALTDAALAVGEDARIGRLLPRACSIAPYERRFLHARAVYRLRNHMPARSAANCWSRILRIDPEDSVAADCLEKLVKGADANAFQYAYTLGKSENERRRAVLQTAALMTKEELAVQWKRSVSLRTVCRWGLRCGDAQTKEFARRVLRTADDDFARELLAETPPEQKKAYNRAVPVYMISADENGGVYLPPLRWRRLARRAVSAAERLCPQAVNAVYVMMLLLLQSEGEKAPMRDPDALAAALLYKGARAVDAELSVHQCAQELATSDRALLRQAERIKTDEPGEGKPCS